MLKASLNLAAIFGAVAIFLISASGASAHADVLSKSDIATYRAAFDAAEKGTWRRANKLTKRAKNPLPAKALTWLRYKTPRSGTKFSAIAAFIDENPNWPHRLELRRRAEETMGSSLSDDAALAWYKRYPPITSPGSTRYARALVRTGQRAKAVTFVRKTWLRLDMGWREERAFRREFRKMLRKEDHIGRLDRLIWDQRVRPARRQMRRVGIGHQHLALARIQLMLRAGGVDGAIARVPENLQDDPGLVYERLRWRRRKGFSDRAVELLRDPPVQTDRPDKWWRERAILARRALREGDITLAYRLARDHQKGDPRSFAEAEWLAGWIALRFLGDHDIALNHFTRLYNNVRFPVSRARGAYWAGRAVEESGKARITEQWYRNAAKHVTTFYGQLAINKLRQNDQIQPPREPKPSAKEIRSFERRELVRLIRMLAKLDEDELLNVFVTRLSKDAGSPTEFALIAKLASEIGRDDLSIKVSKQAIREGVVLTIKGYPERTVPRRYADDRALIHAVIRQESAFDPEAISGAGARGLMQLMPATARLVAKQMKVRYSRRRLTADPTHNLSLGGAYLDQLRNYYDGSVVLALAAYNAGPGRVNRWLKQYGDPRDFSTIEAIDWVEGIPIPETRNYVQRVLENFLIYGYRFEDDFLPVLLIDALTGSNKTDAP